MSALFAIGFILSGYIINIQTYTVSEAMTSTFGIDMMLIAVIFTVLLYVMIAGGLKGIGKWASILVPFMCIFYLIGGVIIICQNITAVPECIALIFTSAFNGTAAVGGFAGAAASLAIKTGMARSVFSNEAGWGSAPMIHASAKVDHPVKQGMLGIFEVFIDTFIVCTLTCLICMVTGEWSSGLEGASLTLAAFESGMGSVGRIILALGVFLFGITTASGLYAEIEVIVRYIVGDTKIKNIALAFYKWTYPIPALALVAVSVYNEFSDSTVWIISDATTALPIFINVFSLFILAPKFAELVKDYNARHLGEGKVDKDFRVFYEE